jgi:hypothetical protein
MAQVTGIDLTKVYFRLYLLPQILLLALELALVGRVLTRNAWVGPVAAGLMLFVGEVDLDPRQQAPTGGFDGVFFDNLFYNPPFLFGLVLFLPLLLLLYRRVAAGSTGRVRAWLLVVAFMIGCQGAKVSILPVVVGGLAVFALWRRLTEGRFNRAALIGVAAGVAVMVGSYLLQYVGQSTGSSISAFASTDQMFALQLIKEWLHHSLHIPQLIVDVAAPVLGTVALLGPPLVGVPLLLANRGRRLETHQVLLLSILVVGLAAFFLIDRNYEFFLGYAYVAGGILSAEQIVALFSRERASGRPLRRLWVVAAVWLALLGLAIAVPSIVWDPVGAAANRPLYAAWYLGLALVLLAVYLAGRRRGGIAGLRTSVVVVTLILLVGALDAPLDHGLRAAKGQHPLWAYLLPDGMSGQLYAGLTWIRAHTSPDDVLAVNNHLVGTRVLPRYFYYSAFTQRRVFLEDWSFSAKGAGEPVNPFPERVTLNNAVFEHANIDAMRTLATRYGVSYLVVDRRLAVSPKLRDEARLRFANSAVEVYSIRTHG